METILISGCLLGLNCRYDGGNSFHEAVLDLKEKYNLIPICPEILGGLTTPREPCEIKDGRVISKWGKDLTENYLRGGEEAYYLARLLGANKAILKERSPSCGKGIIYDGSFSNTRTSGNGVATALLLEKGIEVYGESEINKLL